MNVSKWLTILLRLIWSIWYESLMKIALFLLSGDRATLALNYFKKSFDHWRWWKNFQYSKSKPMCELDFAQSWSIFSYVVNVKVWNFFIVCQIRLKKLIEFAVECICTPGSCMPVWLNCFKPVDKWFFFVRTSFTYPYDRSNRQ